MFRIASLFLIQRLKGSMSGDVHAISAGAIEGYFEGKTLRESHQGGLVLAQQCSGSPGTCNPEETGLPGLPIS